MPTKTSPAVVKRIVKGGEEVGGCGYARRVSYEKHDHEMPDGMHFLNVPRSLLDDVGRVAIVAGRIEQSAYDIAGILGMPQPYRSPNFGKQCADIVARLEDPWCPSWFKMVRECAWRQEVIDWAKDAPKVMDAHRNAIMHRHYFSSRLHEERWHTAFNPDRRNRIKSEPLTPELLSTAVDALLKASNVGGDLWMEWIKLMQGMRAAMEAARAENPSDHA